MTWQDVPVLVTGATGFLGGHLVRRLLAEGAQVRALVRTPAKAQRLPQHPRLRLTVGHLEDVPSLERATQGIQIVFHGAAALGGDYASQFRANVAGTRAIAHASLQAGVQRLVHVSSVASYGYGHTGKIYEDTPPQPSPDPYALTKRLAESALISVAHGTSLSYSITRAGAIYGEGANLWTDTLFQLARLRPLPFVGDGRGIAPLIYIDDLLEQLLIQAQHPAAANQAFNAVHPQAITWRHYLQAHARLVANDTWLSLPYPLLMLGAHLATLGAPLLATRRALPDILSMVRTPAQVSMDKAHALLAWQPQVTLEQALERLLPYFRHKAWVQ